METPNWAATAFALRLSSSRMHRANITLAGVRNEAVRRWLLILPGVGVSLRRKVCLPCSREETRMSADLRVFDQSGENNRIGNRHWV